MPDFTPDTYKRLLSTLLKHNYSFQPFIDFIRNPESRSIILRHDVDARKMNSLKTAILESELGIRGTYYFRMVPESFDDKVIKQIYDLGHEIGYHYEDLANCAARIKRLHDRTTARPHDKALPVRELANIAVSSFRENLAKLRRVVPIETICMHGSPLSRWDNRLLWKYYDYRDFGIVGEPYFDIDFEKVLYLTDTGRRWDGGAVAIRDKVTGREGLRDEETERRRDDFHSTFDIVNAARENKLPDRIMLTVHPQRWDDRPLPWIRELVWQNVKNIVKRVVVRRPGV